MIEKILKFWTEKHLIWQQKKNIASLSLLENYLTDAVTKGEKVRSNQLIDVQSKLDESKKFLKYLTGK